MKKQTNKQRQAVLVGLGESPRVLIRDDGIGFERLESAESGGEKDYREERARKEDPGWESGEAGGYKARAGQRRARKGDGSKAWARM
jgi:hypothetical protein